MRTLAEVMKDKGFHKPLKSDMRELDGKPVVVEGFSTNEGDRGTYIRILFHFPNTDTKRYVQTGAVDVIYTLTELERTNNLPCELTFRQDGRSIVCE